MPGLVQVAVKYRAVQRDFEGTEEGGDGRPYSWPMCWIVPLSMPFSHPSPKGLGSSDNPSLNPLPGQLLCFLDSLRVIQLTQKKT